MSERKVFLPVLWHVRRRNWCVIGSCGLAVGFGGCTFPFTGIDELQGIRRDGELDLAVAVFVLPQSIKRDYAVGRPKPKQTLPGPGKVCPWIISQYRNQSQTRH